MRRLFFALALPRSRRNLTTQPRPIKKIAPLEALSWGSASRPPARRGDLVPRRGANLLFCTPLNLQKATQRKRCHFAKNTPLNLLPHERNPIVAQKNIPFYTIFPPFVLACFLQIEGGCEKANSHPRGGSNPRARRAGERLSEPRDKAAGGANFVIRCGCVLRSSWERDAEKLISKIKFAIFFHKIFFPQAVLS